MTPDRWISALEQGALALPMERRALIMTPPCESHLERLDAQSMVVVQGFFPDHARLAARGFDLVPELPDEDIAPFDLALVFLGKSKALSKSHIAEALVHLRAGGVLIVEGAKTEGIEAILRDLRPYFDVVEVFSKAHGKVIWLTRPAELPEDLADWIAIPQEVTGGFLVPAGGFSADGPDAGSELLVALVPQLKGQVADLGAGWGYIAAQLLDEHAAIAQLDLIEADYNALEAARANIDDSRARFHWADATDFAAETRYDAIVTNPPFHRGRAAEPALGQAFIAAASRLLKPSGQFFMVANRHLPYEMALKTHFATGRMLAEIQGYKLYQAAKPILSRRADIRGNR